MARSLEEKWMERISLSRLSVWNDLDGRSLTFERKSRLLVRRMCKKNFYLVYIENSYGRVK